MDDGFLAKVRSARRRKEEKQLSRQKNFSLMRKDKTKLREIILRRRMLAKVRSSTRWQHEAYDTVIFPKREPVEKAEEVEEWEEVERPVGWWEWLFSKKDAKVS